MKRKIFNILIMVVLYLILMITLTLNSNLRNYINSSTTKMIGFRTLVVSPNYNYSDYGKSKLEVINNIVDVYSSKYGQHTFDTDLKSSTMDGKVSLIYSSLNTLPVVSLGRTFRSSDTNVMICPIDFYPDSLTLNSKINRNYIINSKTTLGKIITVKYYTYEYGDTSINPKAINEYTKSFKVVGLYDNKATMNYNNDCYIPSSDLIEIEDSEYIIPDEVKKNYVSVFFVVIDKKENVDKTIKELNKLGWGSEDIEVATNFDTNLIKTINYFNIILVLSILIIVAFMVLHLIRTSNKTKDFNKSYLFKMLCNNLISFVISFIILFIIYLVLINTVFVNFISFGGNISINILDMLLAFIIIILIPFCINYIIYKKRA